MQNIAETNIEQKSISEGFLAALFFIQTSSAISHLFSLVYMLILRTLAEVDIVPL